MILTSTTQSDKYIKVDLSGSLDLSGVEEVEMEFAKLLAENLHLLINMSDVNFIASMGIRMLLSGAKQLKHHKLKLVLAAPCDNVKEALKITNISSIIPCFDTVEEAAATL